MGISNTPKPTVASTTDSCEIQLGDIQSEEERDIVLQLTLPGAQSDGQVEEGGPALRACLSYFDITSSTLVADMTADLAVARRGWELFCGKVGAYFACMHVYTLYMRRGRQLRACA